MAAYAVRYPELAAKSKSVGGEVDMDPNVSPMLIQIRPPEAHRLADSGTRPSTSARC